MPSPGLRLARGSGYRTALVWLILASAGFAGAVRRGFAVPDFGDETEHVVGAHVIAAGGRLYRDFVDPHGPAVYAIGQIFGDLAGYAHPLSFRTIPATGAAMTAFLVGASPALANASARLFAAATFLGLLAIFWGPQGLAFFLYQPLAGFSLAAILLMLTLPCWHGRETRSGAAIAGAASVVSVALAYSYAPAACLLGAAGLVVLEHRRPIILAFLSGAGLAALGIGAWLTAFGDWRGYAVFHILFGQVTYSRFIHFNWRETFTSLVPVFARDRCLHAAAVGVAAVAFVSWALAMRRANSRLRLGIVLGVLGVIWGNPRGSPIFQDAAFVILACAAFAAAVGQAFGASARGVPIAVTAGSILMCLVAMRFAVSTPHGLSWHQLWRAPPARLRASNEPWAVALRRAVRPDERILALPYEPGIYVRADRLPMSGFYQYLPWDAAYAAKPLLGTPHDLCAALARNPPPVIYDNFWVVWDSYDPRRYMPCVTALIEQSYTPAPGARNFYVRNDRIGAWRGG